MKFRNDNEKKELLETLVEIFEDAHGAALEVSIERHVLARILFSARQAVEEMDNGYKLELDPITGILDYREVRQ